MFADIFLSLFLYALLAEAPILPYTQAPPPRIDSPSNKALSAAEAEIHTIFPVKMPAKEATRTLRLFFNDSKTIRITPLVNINCVLISASRKDTEQATSLLKMIDMPPDRQEVEIYPLKDGFLDEGLERAVRLLFPDEKAGSFAADRRRGLLIVRANRGTHIKVEAILKRLEEATPSAKPETASGSLQVRVAWLVGGLKHDDADRPSDEFNEVVREIEKLGVEKPRLAGQAMVRVAPGTPFEANGLAKLTVPYQMTASGMVGAAASKDAVLLDIKIAAGQESGRNPARLCGLRTRIEVPLGRLVVLGVAPANGMTSAFAVEVSRRQTARPEEKRVSFEFRAKPWPAVFEWFKEVTGLPILSQYMPQGTFTFVPPSTKTTYTIPEVTDIINEALEAEDKGNQCILIRRSSSYTLVPADRQLNPRLGHVTYDELAECATMEIVQMALPLKSVRAEDLVPVVKKLMTRNGEVVALKPNVLVMQDRVRNLRVIIPLIRKMDSEVKK